MQHFSVLFAASAVRRAFLVDFSPDFDNSNAGAQKVNVRFVPRLPSKSKGRPLRSTKSPRSASSPILRYGRGENRSKSTENRSQIGPGRTPEHHGSAPRAISSPEAPRSSSGPEPRGQSTDSGAPLEARARSRARVLPQGVLLSPPGPVLIY
jgi:hypothetical protein